MDGHNLIPHVPGLSLSDLDDEQRLIEMVQEYCRIQRKQAEIYFDNAPPGFAGMKKIGMVKVKFARQGRSADLEIKERLVVLGKTARNWVVVTSDGEVKLAARSVRAQVLSSQEFASELWRTLQNKNAGEQAGSEEILSDEELQHWLSIFQQGKPK